MKKRYTEQQIIYALKQAEEGDRTEIEKMHLADDGSIYVKFGDQVFRRDSPLSAKRLTENLEALEQFTGIDPRDGRSQLTQLPTSYEKTK